MSLAAADRKRRLRWGAGYKPIPADIEVPWADDVCAPFTSRVDREATLRAEQVLLMTQSKAWVEIVLPECRRVDAKRKAPLYALSDLLLFEAFARNTGVNVKRARGILAGDSGVEARRLLGFDVPRNPPEREKRMKLLNGVPSRSTVSRLNRWFPEQERAVMWERFAAALRDEHLGMPELQAELDHIAGDGTYIETRYSAPVVNTETGEIVNRPTALTAGHTARKTDGTPTDGWSLFPMFTLSYVPLVYSVDQIQTSERTVATVLVRDELSKVLRQYRSGDVGFAVFDGGVHCQPLRAELRKMNYVESVPLCSHYNQERADELSAQEYDIADFPGWKANGHREIYCAKHKTRAAKRALRIRKSGVSVGVEGKCAECTKLEAKELHVKQKFRSVVGSISVSSGDFRLSTDRKNFVRRNTGDPVETLDFALGNPLTYNDLNAAHYGTARWAAENFNRMLSARFGLTRGKRWIKTHDRARLETAISFSLIHAISMDHRRRKRELEAVEPPPLAQAA